MSCFTLYTKNNLLFKNRDARLLHLSPHTLPFGYWCALSRLQLLVDPDSSFNYYINPFDARDSAYISSQRKSVRGYRLLRKLFR